SQHLPQGPGQVASAPLLVLQHQLTGHITVRCQRIRRRRRQGPRIPSVRPSPRTALAAHTTRSPVDVTTRATGRESEVEGTIGGGTQLREEPAGNVEHCRSMDRPTDNGRCARATDYPG